MDVKPYSCNKCGKTFKSLAGREYHLNKNVCTERKTTPAHVSMLLKGGHGSNIHPEVAKQLINFSKTPSVARNTAKAIAMLETTPIKVALDKRAGEPSKYQCPACFKPLGTPQAYKYHTTMNVCLKRAERKRKKIIGEVIDSNKSPKTLPTTTITPHKTIVPVTVPPASAPMRTPAPQRPVQQVEKVVSRPVSVANGITMDPNVAKGYKKHKRFYEIGM